MSTNVRQHKNARVQYLIETHIERIQLTSDYQYPSMQSVYDDPVTAWRSCLQVHRNGFAALSPCDLPVLAHPLPGRARGHMSLPSNFQ